MKNSNYTTYTSFAEINIGSMIAYDAYIRLNSSEEMLDEATIRELTNILYKFILDYSYNHIHNSFPKLSSYLDAEDIAIDVATSLITSPNFMKSDLPNNGSLVVYIKKACGFRYYDFIKKSSFKHYISDKEYSDIKKSDSPVKLDILKHIKTDKNGHYFYKFNNSTSLDAPCDSNRLSSSPSSSTIYDYISCDDKINIDKIIEVKNDVKERFEELMKKDAKTFKKKVIRAVTFMTYMNDAVCAPIYDGIDFLSNNNEEYIYLSEIDLFCSFYKFLKTIKHNLRCIDFSLNEISSILAIEDIDNISVIDFKFSKKSLKEAVSRDRAYIRHHYTKSPDDIHDSLTLTR